MMTTMDAIGTLLDEITERLPVDRRALRTLKADVATRFGQPMLPNDRLLARYRREVAGGRRSSNTVVERILTLNGIRSQSGVATVTVITEPYACPGRCVYCPTDARAPKSYLPNEPAVLRAIRSGYDPYRQMRSRLEALDETGHPTDKLELIIKGGTWSFYPETYQRWFVQRCVEAANAFRHSKGAARAGTLEQALTDNETAGCRIIGTTIETRPDYITAREITRLRALGVTRVELGVQSLEERVLARIVRDHTTAEIRAATAMLRDAGLKIAYHLMPNLPGATPETDRASMRELFTNPAYQPDTLKIYPCVVIESAELSAWWRAGRYQPYDDETLLALLIDLKQLVPPYVRIERVIRDIPSTSIQAGSRITNLREAVHRRMRERGLRCRCIRCRQVRDERTGTFRRIRRTYDAAGGREIFLSYEDAAADRLVSFLRLRIPTTAHPTPHRPSVLEGAALIRELHTYGPHLPLRERSEEAAQHHGFGVRLLREAERIVREETDLRRVAVIAGVGVREYYRRFGYALAGTYMIKTLGSDPPHENLGNPCGGSDPDARAGERVS